MKYIGPFLRINSLNKGNIENQLIYLSKEAMKYIVLHSKCGITFPVDKLRLKGIPNIDINTINTFSPLLCIYKKSNPKLVPSGERLSFEEDTFKKEITITSNAYMTLCLLELADLYEKFRDVDNKKYSLAWLYKDMCKKQLEFYASYLRNENGVFVDKKDLSDNITQDLVLEEKNKKFKFSDQALLMAAYYRYSLLDQGEDNNDYRSFSMDILNMLMQYKDDIYDVSFDELLKVCFALNIFYKYSKLEEVKPLLIDFTELMMENYKFGLEFNIEDKLEHDCMVFINNILAYDNTKLTKFKDSSQSIYDKLVDLYNPESGIFIKESDKKEVDFSSSEIILYLLCMILHSKVDKENSNDKMIILDVFKRQVIDSGIILSWPESPDLNDIERYSNYTMKSEDMLEDQHFRMPNLPTPENAELAPVFIKEISYNKKKEAFKQSKLTFDSSKNMFIYFITTFVLRQVELE